MVPLSTYLGMVDSVLVSVRISMKLAEAIKSNSIKIGDELISFFNADNVDNIISDFEDVLEMVQDERAACLEKYS